MKKAIFILIILAVSSVGYAQDNIGRLVRVIGDIDITDSHTGEVIVPRPGTPVSTTHRIRTGNRAYLEITLNDATKIFMREATVIRISNFKKERADAPTRIKMLTGKIRVNVSRPADTRTLIVETSVAIAGVPASAADFGVITTRREARVVLFDGMLDVANSNPSIIKSYSLKKKEESLIPADRPPTNPVVLPSDILDSWLDYYDISSGDRIVVKGKEGDGIIGHILKKRKF